MSGLSYFNTGGTTEEDAPEVMVKPTSVKGLPSLANNLSVGPGVLSAMEQLYQDRLAKQSGFMEGMKDAAAWWSGGVEGPSAALAKRDVERRAQEENLFQLQTQIAQFKAAQEAQKRFEQRRGKELGLGGTQPAGAQPGSVDAMFGMPPNIRLALANAKTEAEYDKIFTDWAKKTAEQEASPEFDVPKIPVVTWNEETGEWQRDVISARQLRANPRKYFGEDGKPATAPTQAAPAPAAAAPVTEAPVSSDLTAEDMAIPRAAPASAPVAAAAQPVNYTFDELSPEQVAMMKTKAADMGLLGDITSRPDAAELFNKQPLEKRKAIFDRLIPEPTQLAVAPGATATDVAAPTTGAMRAPQAPTQTAQRPPRPTAGQLERQAEVDKEVAIAAEKERLKTDADERKKFQTESDPTKTSERKIRAERVQKMVLEDPTIVGVLSQGNVKSAIANVLQQGLSTPSGSISVKGLSDAIFQTLPTTISMAKRREIAGYIAQMELDASQAMNGQGQISDGERDIIRAASVSIEDPAEVVYKKAKMMQLRQETLQKLRGIYGSGAAYSKNFMAFQNEPRYKQIEAEYEARLRNIANEDVKIDRSMVGRVGNQPGKPNQKPNAPTAFEDADKERRYQEWKRSQGK